MEDVGVRYLLMIRSTGAILCLLLSIPLTGKLFAQSQPVPQGLVGGQAASFVLGQRNFSDISFCTATLIEAETEDETTTFECIGPSNRSLDDNDRATLSGTLPKTLAANTWDRSPGSLSPPTS